MNVGIDHDTAQFAVELDPQLVGAPRPAALPERHHGCRSPPTAAAPTATAPELWKVELQKLADETELEIAVCHFPPGTSKWNQIEHRLFSFITMNWRGKPLVSLETIINLIGATKTSTGLEVYARLDPATYPDKIKVSDAELKTVNLRGDKFHPEWNYTIKPRT